MWQDKYPGYLEICIDLMYITEFLSLTQLVIREKKSYASEDTMTIQGSPTLKQDF